METTLATMPTYNIDLAKMDSKTAKAIIKSMDSQALRNDVLTFSSQALDMGKTLLLHPVIGMVLGVVAINMIEDTKYLDAITAGLLKAIVVSSGTISALSPFK